MKARAVEIFKHQQQEEQVLGDDKAVRRQLPNSAKESRRERQLNADDRRNGAQQNDQELVRETSTSGQRGDDGELLDSMEES